MIEFHLDGGSGLSPYQQIVRQVRHALRLGLLNEGDQLPTVKDVVADGFVTKEELCTGSFAKLCTDNGIS